MKSTNKQTKRTLLDTLNHVAREPISKQKNMIASGSCGNKAGSTEAAAEVQSTGYRDKGDLRTGKRVKVQDVRRGSGRF